MPVIPDPTYNPKRLKIVSVGIGIGDDTNSTLNLTDDQHLIVGETRVQAGSNLLKQYGLIVDKQGVAINTTLDDRATASNLYAAYIQGNVFIQGTLTANNIIGGGSGSNLGPTGSNFWIQATGDQETIYYPGRITVGNHGTGTAAANNTHAIHVIEAADRTIDHAQINLQNTGLAEFRLGILGLSNISPAVVNTPPGVPIEFHAGRSQTYFSNVYRRQYFEYGSNVITDADLPAYAYGGVAGQYYGYADDPAAAPHLCIDPSGAVGVRISRIPTLTAEQAAPIPTPTGDTFPLVSEKMALHVNGSTFSSNVLIWDYQSNAAVNIDRLFVRRYGATFDADQIIPGPFQDGNFTFPGRVGIGSQIAVPNSNFSLTADRAKITEYLEMDGLASMNRMEIRNAVLLDIASFCNDVYINRDIIVKEAIRLRGNMFAQVPRGNDLVWCNVQFTVQDYEWSNVNAFGAGITTPGRLGVGIDPVFDEVNNQCVVVSRANDLFELELRNEQSASLAKIAYIGHLGPSGDRANDASLIFATPPEYYALNLRPGPAPQNFYFYPGGLLDNHTEPIVADYNPPVLNVDTTRRVGILTFDPLAALDVRGDVAVSGSIYVIDSNAAVIDADTPRVGLWLERNFATPLPGGSTAYSRGLEYRNAGISNVGIHRIPDARYGVVIGAGGLKAVDYFREDDRRIGHWVRSDPGVILDPTTTLNSGSLWTTQSVGIGLGDASNYGMLAVKNPRTANTLVKLYRGDTSTGTTELHFASPTRAPWIFRATDLQHRFEFAHDCNVLADPTAKRAFWARYQPEFNRTQLILGGDLGVFDVARGHPDPNARVSVDGNLAVLGDVRISGHYYMNGNLFVNTNMTGPVPIPDSNQDIIYLRGNVVNFEPYNYVSAGVEYKGFVGVGYDGAAIAQEQTTTDTTMLRVYQRDPENPSIARFKATGNNALIDVENGSGDKLRFGIYSGATFAFLDQNNNPYLSFVRNAELGLNYLGLNKEPLKDISASLHIHNSSTGQNMLRLTRFGTGDTPGAAAEVELEKKILVGLETRTTRWRIHGPDAYQQKLAFIYAQDANPVLGDVASSNEVLTVAANGCVGIGNTEPEFAVDIRSSDARGSIRILNTGPTPRPQLIFQSDGTVFGADNSTDYRFYSSNNHFVLDAQDTLYGFQTVLDVGAAASNIGVLTAADARYGMNVGGSLNLRSTLYVDGNPVFSTGDDSTNSVFQIRATNIYLKPVIADYGGVGINTSAPTSNLFYLFSGTNGTMAVFDSQYDRSVIHFRARASAGSMVFPRWMAGQSNNDYFMSYASNLPRSITLGDSETGYGRAWTITPVAGSGAATTRFNGDLWTSRTAFLSCVIPRSTIVCADSNAGALGAAGHPAHTGAVFQILGDGGQAALSLGTLSGAAGTTALVVASNAVPRMVVAADGAIGVGTATPAAPIHVVGGSIIVPGVAFAAPSLASVGVSATAVAADTLSIRTSNIDRIRIDPAGRVGISTATPGAVLGVFGASNIGNLVSVQSASNALPCFTVADTGRVAAGYGLDVSGDVGVVGNVVPSGAGRTLGTAANRWAELYLSGNSLDIGTTKISRDAGTGNLRIYYPGDNTVRSVIVNTIQLGDRTDPISVNVERGTASPVAFRVFDSSTQLDTILEPLIKDAGTGAIAIGKPFAAAFLDVLGTSALPSAICDHIAGCNHPFVMDVRNGGTSLFRVDSNAVVLSEVGRVSASNAAAAAWTVRQRDSGPILSLESDAMAAGSNVVVAASGFVGIGTAAPLVALDIRGQVRASQYTYFGSNVQIQGDLDVEGDIRNRGNVLSTSDLRFKSDLTRIDGALDRLSALSGYTYLRNGVEARQTGLVAQEVAAVLPEAVRADGEGFLSVAYGNLMGLVVEAIKELRAEVAALRSAAA